MPLFQQLHAYLRRRLWLAHGQDSDVIDREGPIPASLLGKQLCFLFQTYFGSICKYQSTERGKGLLGF